MDAHTKFRIRYGNCLPNRRWRQPLADLHDPGNSPRERLCPPIPHMNVGQGPGAGGFQMYPMDGGDFFGSHGVLPMKISVQHRVALHWSYFTYRLSHSGRAWTSPQHLVLNMADIQSKSTFLAERYVRPVFDIASRIAWYYADTSRLSYTTDAGRHWTYRSTHLPPGYVPDGIRFVSPRSGYLWATSLNASGSPRSIMRWTGDGGLRMAASCSAGGKLATGAPPCVGRGENSTRQAEPFVSQVRIKSGSRSRQTELDVLVGSR
jgi:hypothetical protein